MKAAYGAFRCQDGHYLSIAALEDHFWKRLCTVLDLAPFDGEAHRHHEARKAQSDAINLRIAQAVERWDAQALFGLLQQHDIPVAPVVAPSQLSSLPHFTLREKFAAGDVMPLVKFPVPMAGLSSVEMDGAPKLGSLTR